MHEILLKIKNFKNGYKTGFQIRYIFSASNISILVNNTATKQLLNSYSLQFVPVFLSKNVFLVKKINLRMLV